MVVLISCSATPLHIANEKVLQESDNGITKWIFGDRNTICSTSWCAANWNSCKHVKPQHHHIIIKRDGYGNLWVFTHTDQFIRDPDCDFLFSYNKRLVVPDHFDIDVALQKNQFAYKEFIIGTQVDTAKETHQIIKMKDGTITASSIQWKRAMSNDPKCYPKYLWIMKSEENGDKIAHYAVFKALDLVGQQYTPLRYSDTERTTRFQSDVAMLAQSLINVFHINADDNCHSDAFNRYLTEFWRNRKTYHNDTTTAYVPPEIPKGCGAIFVIDRETQESCVTIPSVTIQLEINQKEQEHRENNSKRLTVLSQQRTRHSIEMTEIVLEAQQNSAIMAAEKNAQLKNLEQTSRNLMEIQEQEEKIRQDKRRSEAQFLESAHMFELSQLKKKEEHAQKTQKLLQETLTVQRIISHRLIKENVNHALDIVSTISNSSNERFSKQVLDLLVPYVIHQVINRSYDKTLLDVNNREKLEHTLSLKRIGERTTIEASKDAKLIVADPRYLMPPSGYHLTDSRTELSKEIHRNETI